MIFIYYDQVSVNLAREVVFHPNSTSLLSSTLEYIYSKQYYENIIWVDM